MENIYKVHKDGAAHQRISRWCADRLDVWSRDHTREVWDTLAGPTHLLFTGEEYAEHTVVFVPGTNFSAAASLPELEILAARHRVIALDVPGEPGLSCERRVQDARMHQLAAWLTQVLDRLDRPVTVLGHSLGASIAMSATSPMISRRILLSPAGIRRLRVPFTLMASSLMWMLRPNAAASQNLLRHMCGPGQVPTPEQVKWMTLVGRSVRTGLDPGRLPDSVLRQAATSPCLVATGEHDVFVSPDRVRDRARALLGAEVHALPCGHLLDEGSWSDVSELVARG